MLVSVAPATSSAVRRGLVGAVGRVLPRRLLLQLNSLLEGQAAVAQHCGGCACQERCMQRMPKQA